MQDPGDLFVLSILAAVVGRQASQGSCGQLQEEGAGGFLSRASRELGEQGEAAVAIDQDVQGSLVGVEKRSRFPSVPVQSAGWRPGGGKSIKTRLEIGLA